MVDKVKVDYWQASSMLHDGGFNLGLATAGKPSDPTSSCHYESAMRMIQRGIYELGYDMVLRKTPAQMHDEAVAARKAEDAGDFTMGF